MADQEFRFGMRGRGADRFRIHRDYLKREEGRYRRRIGRGQFIEGWGDRKPPLAPGQAAPVPPAAPPTDNAAPFNGPPPPPLPAAGGLTQPSTNAFPNNQPAPQPPVAQPAAPPLPAAAVGAAPQPAAAPAAPTTPAVSPFANFGGGLRLRNYRGLFRR